MLITPVKAYKPSTELLTTREVAEKCNVTAVCVAKWIRTGKLEGERVGNRYYVSLLNVKIFIGNRNAHKGANKAEIMKQAHKLYNEGGYTQSQALSESWRLYNLNTLETRLFSLQMKDHFDHDDWKLRNELASAIRELTDAADKRVA